MRYARRQVFTLQLGISSTSSKRLFAPLVLSLFTDSLMNSPLYTFHCPAHWQLTEAQQAKKQAIIAKESIQGQLTKAEDKLRDLEEDQRALKKQFGRKISKLRQEAEDAMLAKNAALQEVIYSSPGEEVLPAPEDFPESYPIFSSWRRSKSPLRLVLQL